MSKAGVAPNESNQKQENKPEKENPEKENLNNNKKDNDKNDPQKIDDALKKYYNDNPLRDGEYSGWGIEEKSPYISELMEELWEKEEISNEFWEDRFEDSHRNEKKPTGHDPGEECRRDS